MAKNNSLGFLLKFDSSDVHKKLKNLKGDFNSFNKTARETGDVIKTAFQTTSLIGFAIALKNITQTMLKASKAETEYIENMNLLQNAYDGNTDSAQKLINTMSDFYGLDPSGVTKQLGTYRQMSSALGITADKANLLSENMIKLQEDVSSLYNISNQMANSKLTSALTGQTKPIRALGADITEASLQQELYNRGIDKSVKEMNRASKTILIYLAMERQLVNANGDAARTINSVANQSRIFTEQLAVAGRQIGAVFIPVLRTLLPILNGILMALNAIGELMLGMLGIDAQKLAKEFGIGSTSIELDLDDIGSSASDASKKVKELQLGLRSFDKLNVIKTPTSTKSSSSGSVGTGLGKVDNDVLNALKEYNQQLDNAKNKATDIRDKIMDWLGFTKQVDIETGKVTWKLEEGWTRFRLIRDVLIAIAGIKLVQIFKKVADYVYNWYKNTNGLLKPSREMFEYYKNLRKEGKGIFESIKETKKTWLETATTMDKVKYAMMGVAEAVSGILIFTTALQDIQTNGPSVVSVIGLLAGAFLVVKGAVDAVTGSVALLDASLAANPYTAIIGLLVGTAGLVASYLAVESAVNKTTDATLRLDEAQRTSLEGYAQQMENAQMLGEELGRLIGSNGRVKDSDKERAEYIINELNKALDSEFELTGNQITLNGKLIDSQKKITQEISNYVVTLKGKHMLQQQEQNYNNLLAKQYEYEQKLNGAKDAHNKKLDDLNKKIHDNIISQEEYNEEVRIENEAYDRLKKSIDNTYSSAMEQLKLLENLSYAVSTGNIKDINKYYNDVMAQNTETAADWSKTYTNSLNVLSKQIANSTKTYFENIKPDLYNAGSSGANEYFKGFQNTMNKKNITVNASVATPNVKTKADGGFLNTGDVFIAREAGPEMVGRINGHTAVANNDQIVEAISIGVAKAMSATSGNKPVIIEAKGDTQGLLDFIQFKQQQKDRQFGL